MSKRKPNKVYSVNGVIVLARSPKGAVSVFKDHGHTSDGPPTIDEAPEATAAQAINAKAGG